MNKLKKKWGINSDLQLILILIVFSITGFVSMLIAKPILNLFGLEQKTMSVWAFWPIRIAIIFPIYQILILIFGFLFGQFKFFWDFEKKMIKRLGLKRLLKINEFSELISLRFLKKLTLEFVDSLEFTFP